MTELHVAVKDETATFLKSYAEREQISLSELLEKVATAIQSLERASIHPTVQALTGVVQKSEQTQEAFYQHLSEKHQ
jgi:hypothetical protein